MSIRDRTGMPPAYVPGTYSTMPQAAVPGTLDPVMYLGLPQIRQAAMTPQVQPLSYGYGGSSENAAPAFYGHGGSSENAMPPASASAPRPVPPSYVPPPRQQARQPAPGGGLTADDLNSLSLAAIRGEAMPAGGNDAAWANLLRMVGRG